MPRFAVPCGPTIGDDMSDGPVFIYAATYTSYDDCLADYELLLEAHAANLVGTYDVALIRKDNEGKIHVEKHEKPTQHGAWGGIAVGALVGVLFPPSVLGAAAVGGQSMHSRPRRCRESFAASSGRAPRRCSRDEIARRARAGFCAPPP